MFWIKITACCLQVHEDDDEFLDRIRKTLYYGKLPPTERLSLPMTGKC